VNYILTILSSGRPLYLERTLVALEQFLTPKPSAIFLFMDGVSPGDAIGARSVAALGAFRDVGVPVDVAGHTGMLGQCAAQAKCWEAAAESDCEWAFHIEDDLVLLRPLDLLDLAEVLVAEPNVPQMALVRCPWGAEIEHGGYIPMVPGLYERRTTTIAGTARTVFSETVVVVEREEQWIVTKRNWANAPALMRTSFARDFDWPAEPGCETAVGPLLFERNPDTEFGLWGWGEPWVAHIGVERAPGSHGY
jgi:hypothetical protein